MRAVLRHRYGAPALVDTPAPTVSSGRVVLRVEAASVNRLDAYALAGSPYVMRLSSGLRRPSDPRLGTDAAGTVVAVADDVDDFEVGDRIVAPVAGAFAEIATARATGAVRLPDGVSVREAACLPVAGYTALQFLRRAGVRSDSHVLVHGAGGGVGHLAVSLARVLGAARVDAACSPASRPFVETLGADEVHDLDGATDARHVYDVILDTVGTTPLPRLRPLLRPGGAIAAVGGIHRAWLNPLTEAARRRLASRRDARVIGGYAQWSCDDLATLVGALSSGALHPRITGEFTLEETIDALHRMSLGHVRGKLVVLPG